MGDCMHLDAKVTVSGDVGARVSCSDMPKAAVSLGTVLVRDGTNNYEQLANKPRINGAVLEGDKDFQQLGLNRVTEQAIDNLLYG